MMHYWSNSQGNTNSFSMQFNHNFFDESSSSVDCTLSLGTPSTRLSQNDDKRKHHDRRSGHSYGDNISSSDSLFARRCANCDTTTTPLWRNGPRGPKSLCNACGIRFKKEERRATAAATGARNVSVMEDQYMYNHNSDAQKMIPYFSPAIIGNDNEQTSADAGVSFLSWSLNVADKRQNIIHDFTR